MQVLKPAQEMKRREDIRPGDRHSGRGLLGAQGCCGAAMGSGLGRQGDLGTWGTGSSRCHPCGAGTVSLGNQYEQKMPFSYILLIWKEVQRKIEKVLVV